MRPDPAVWSALHPGVALEWFTLGNMAGARLQGAWVRHVLRRVKPLRGSFASLRPFG